MTTKQIMAAYLSFSNDALLRILMETIKKAGMVIYVRYALYETGTTRPTPPKTNRVTRIKLENGKCMSFSEKR